MRVTIIPADSVVLVDGVIAENIDLSAIPPEVHAVQWYKTWGEVEIACLETRRIIENRRITDFSEYSFVVSLWEQRIAELQASANGGIPVINL